MTPNLVPKPLRDSSPATRLVFVALTDGPQTAGELARSTALSEPTVYRSVERLKEHDMATSDPDPRRPNREIHNLTNNYSHLQTTE